MFIQDHSVYPIFGELQRSGLVLLSTILKKSRSKYPEYESPSRHQDSRSSNGKVTEIQCRKRYQTERKGLPKINLDPKGEFQGAGNQNVTHGI